MVLRLVTVSIFMLIAIVEPAETSAGMPTLTVTPAALTKVVDTDIISVRVISKAIAILDLPNFFIISSPGRRQIRNRLQVGVPVYYIITFNEYQRSRRHNELYSNSMIYYTQNYVNSGHFVTFRLIQWLNNRIACRMNRQAIKGGAMKKVLSVVSPTPPLNIIPLLDVFCLF